MTVIFVKIILSFFQVVMLGHGLFYLIKRCFFCLFGATGWEAHHHGWQRATPPDYYYLASLVSCAVRGSSSIMGALKCCSPSCAAIAADEISVHRASRMCPTHGPVSHYYWCANWGDLDRRLHFPIPGLTRDRCTLQTSMIGGVAIPIIDIMHLAIGANWKTVRHTVPYLSIDLTVQHIKKNYINSRQC